MLLREFSDPLKNKIEKCIFSSNTIEALAICIKENLELLDPNLIDTGIYRKIDGFYTRLNPYFNIDSFSGSIINPDFSKRIPRLPETIYDIGTKRLGRYYVTSLKFQDFALVIMSKRRFNLSSLELPLKLALQKTKTLNAVLDKEEELKRFSLDLYYARARAFSDLRKIVEQSHLNLPKEFAYTYLTHLEFDFSGLKLENPGIVGGETFIGSAQIQFGFTIQ